MPGAMRKGDPYLAFRFRVEIDNLDVGGFTEVTGLQVEIELHDYREGGANDAMLRFAGPVKYPSNLILKHGIMDAEVLWNWQREVMRGVIQRRNATIVLLDSAGRDRRRWEFQDVCPVRWSGPDLRASTAEVAIETMELTHRGLISS